MTADLETALLRTFVTAVRSGSISRAASVLGQTQPALSQQLRRLERAVGHQVLRRTSTGVALTGAGETLLPDAERILALSAQGLADTRRTLVGHCGVGLIEDLASARLPQALADFASLHPGATLEVMSTPGPAMRDALESGRLQVALCDTTYLPQPPRWSVRLPLVWAIGPGVDVHTDPLPLILFSQPCRWRTPLLDALNAAGRRWRIVFESTSLAGVQGAVRAGLGIAALLPANLGPDMTAADNEHALPAIQDVEIGLVRRPDTDGNPLIDAVDTLLRQLT
jgi:DNA-binding transcriptional LysR family regulator